MVKIRAAISEDGDALGQFGALLVKLHHEFDPPRFIPASSRTPVAYGRFLASQLAEPDVIVLVADDGGTVIGYTYAGIEGPDYMALRGPAGVIHDLFVDPGRRREGIGRMLFDATIAALQERGATQVVLNTASRNEAAQQLFSSRGFRRTMIEMTRNLD